MIHAKFQYHRTSGSGEEDFKGFYHIWAWRSLGHVAWAIYIKFRSPFPRGLNMKFGFDWPSGF